MDTWVFSDLYCQFAVNEPLLCVSERATYCLHTSSVQSCPFSKPGCLLSTHLRFSNLPKPEICQWAPITAVYLYYMWRIMTTFSSNAYHPNVLIKTTVGHCGCICLIQWRPPSFYSDNYEVIFTSCRVKLTVSPSNSTQLVHYVIDLMKYIHSKTCTHAEAQEWTLKGGQQGHLHQYTNPKDKLPQIEQLAGKQRCSWEKANQSVIIQA